MPEKKYNEFDSLAADDSRITLHADAATGELKKTTWAQLKSFILAAIDTAANYIWSGSNRFDGPFLVRTKRFSDNKGTALRISSVAQLMAPALPNNGDVVLCTVHDLPDYTGEYSAGWGIVIGRPDGVNLRVGNNGFIFSNAAVFSIPHNWNFAGHDTGMKILSPNVDLQIHSTPGWYFRFMGGTTPHMVMRSDTGDVTFGGTSLKPSTKFEIISTDKPSIPFPLMSSTQRNNVASPTAGHCIYNTTTNQPEYYNGSSWVAF